MVSGILWKREKEGMLLEVDSTLLYFFGGRPSQRLPIGRLIRVIILQIRRFAGLVRSATPGIDSIRAAIYPTEHRLLVLLKQARRRHAFFSKTYAEHLINKAKYLN